MVRQELFLANNPDRDTYTLIAKDIRPFKIKIRVQSWEWFDKNSFSQITSREPSSASFNNSWGLMDGSQTMAIYLTDVSVFNTASFCHTVPFTAKGISSTMHAYNSSRQMNNSSSSHHSCSPHFLSPTQIESINADLQTRESEYWRSCWQNIWSKIDHDHEDWSRYRPECWQHYAITPNSPPAIISN